MTRLTRQLSEAVRIELRGTDILNSKSEYSRCRVPRLTVDMEGWKSRNDKTATEIFQKDENITEQEMVLELLRAEAEDSLAERDQPKRKKEDAKTGRKAKRRKLDLLVGWGEAKEGVDEVPATEIRLESKDWTEETKTDGDKNMQSSLEGWIMKENVPERRVENEEIPEGRKQEIATPKTNKRRVRGKLDKKEIIAMKAKHTNIRTMLAAHKHKVEHDEDIASDDLATLEREQRLERVRLRRLEINTRASPHPPSPPLSKVTAHTPVVRPSKSIMNITHSPLIGRDGVIAEQSTSISVKSRAGFKKNIETVHNIHIESGTDTRKAVRSHGSPDKLNIFTKSPMMINGRLEKFTDISNMIPKWGEEEDAILENEKGVKGARRRSQRMIELCKQFETIDDGQKVYPDTDVGGRGEMKFLLKVLWKGGRK